MTEHAQVRLNASLSVLLVAAVVLVLHGGHSPLRSLVVFAALLFVPGGAVLTLLRVGRLTEWAGLAIALSLAVEVAGALILIWTRWWHPEVLAAVLAVLSGAALLTSLGRAHRATRRTAGPGAPALQALHHHG